jgi:hypothetical protein
MDRIIQICPCNSSWVGNPYLASLWDTDSATDSHDRILVAENWRFMEGVV